MVACFLCPSSCSGRAQILSSLSWPSNCLPPTCPSAIIVTRDLVFVPLPQSARKGAPSERGLAFAGPLYCYHLANGAIHPVCVWAALHGPHSMGQSQSVRAPLSDLVGGREAAPAVPCGFSHEPLSAAALCCAVLCARYRAVEQPYMTGGAPAASPTLDSGAQVAHRNTGQAGHLLGPLPRASCGPSAASPERDNTGTGNKCRRNIWWHWSCPRWSRGQLFVLNVALGLQPVSATCLSVGSGTIVEQVAEMGRPIGGQSCFRLLGGRLSIGIVSLAAVRRERDSESINLVAEGAPTRLWRGNKNAARRAAATKTAPWCLPAVSSGKPSGGRARTELCSGAD